MIDAVSGVLDDDPWAVVATEFGEVISFSTDLRMVQFLESRNLSLNDFVLMKLANRDSS